MSIKKNIDNKSLEEATKLESEYGSPLFNSTLTVEVKGEKQINYNHFSEKWGYFVDSLSRGFGTDFDDK